MRHYTNTNNTIDFPKTVTDPVRQEFENVCYPNFGVTSGHRTPMRMYIAVLDEFPDYMTPTLVAHSVLNAHIKFQDIPEYQKWFNESFKKCVVRVNQKEFDKIAQLPNVHLGHENNTLGAKKSCAVVCPVDNNLPNVLKFAKLWKPKEFN